MKWLQAITISFLITANLASAWLVPLIYVDFELREDYIARVLCVERDYSITVCKGRCYLSSQLDKAAEQQEKEKQVGPTEIVFFFQRSVMDATFKTTTETTKKVFPAFEDQKQSNPHLMGIFNPPRS